MPKECCKNTWEKIPDDEPVFIIRGQDLLANEPIAFWIKSAEAAGVSQDKIDRAKEHLTAVSLFHVEHPDRCKIPD